MTPYVLPALISAAVALAVGSVPLVLWGLNRSDTHAEVLIKMLDEYRQQLRDAHARADELSAQIVATKAEREKLLAQVSELRTAVDTTAAQQIRQTEQHGRDLAAMQAQYERLLGEKELQIVGLRARVEELEKRMAGAGADLKGERP